MDDLRRRFERLESLPVPDLWEEARARAAVAHGIVETGATSSRSWTAATLGIAPTWLLVALALVTLLAVGLVSGAVRLGDRRATVPPVSAAPSLALAPTATPVPAPTPTPAPGRAAPSQPVRHARDGAVGRRAGNVRVCVPIRFLPH